MMTETNPLKGIKMIFKDCNLEVTERLNLHRDHKLSFHVAITEPVETRHHLITEGDKIKFVDCLYNSGEVDRCPYCITSKTILKHNPLNNDAKKMIAKKRYHLPVELENGSIRIFSFNKKIKDAYIQLITYAEMYKFDGTNLIYNHNVTSDECSFSNYDTCSFSFRYSPGKKKKKKVQTITVGKLCDDAHNSEYGFIKI